MRYARQETLLGKAAAKKLRNASVAVVGLGGIGSLSSLLCAQLGVKRLILVDYDNVDATNLGRQVLYRESSVGKSKAVEAKRVLGEMNSDVKVATFNELLTSKNASKLLKGADIVLDCTDNYRSRMDVNAYCVKAGVPLVYAAALKFECMLSTILPRKTACLACFGDKGEASILACQQVGVLNSVTSFAASMQVQEMANLLCFGSPVYAGKLFYADLKSGIFHSKELARNPNCRVCGKSQ